VSAIPAVPKREILALIHPHGDLLNIHLARIKPGRYTGVSAGKRQ